MASIECRCAAKNPASASTRATVSRQVCGCWRISASVCRYPAACLSAVDLAASCASRPWGGALTVMPDRSKMKEIESNRRLRQMKRKGQVAPRQSAAVLPSLSQLSLSQGKRARLWRLLYGHGPGNGTLVVLPLDQGLEHGPTDFFPHPPAVDPEYQFELAAEGNYSAIALGIGLADKYMQRYAGRVPLILKLNGKTNIPSDAEATSPLFASVEDAVRLGADAVGYTMYVGSPRQDDELRQYSQVRRDCERFGMPLVLWSYPRGSAIDAKGGKNS